MLFKYSGKYVNIYFNMKITYAHTHTHTHPLFSFANTIENITIFK